MIVSNVKIRSNHVVVQMINSTVLIKFFGDIIYVPYILWVKVGRLTNFQILSAKVSKPMVRKLFTQQILFIVYYIIKFQSFNFFDFLKLEFISM